MTANTFTHGPTLNTIRSADGKLLTAPEDRRLLPPGDAALLPIKSMLDHEGICEV